MRFLAVLVAISLALPARAHSGGTNAAGCHQQGGVTHCHGAGGSSGGDVPVLVIVAIGAGLAVIGALVYLNMEHSRRGVVMLTPTIGERSAGFAIIGRF